MKAVQRILYAAEDSPSVIAEARAMVMEGAPSNGFMSEDGLDENQNLVGESDSISWNHEDS